MIREVERVDEMRELNVESCDRYRCSKSCFEVTDGGSALGVGGGDDDHPSGHLQFIVSFCLFHNTLYHPTTLIYFFQPLITTGCDE